MSTAKLREEYKNTPLLQDRLLPNPINQFAIWFQQAQEAKLHYPHAMSLATASSSFEVSSRIVLLRYFDQRGFAFFTGLHTKKVEHIDTNARVALLFSWLDLERQVKIEGAAEKISVKESLQFFASRSRDSQIGAWLSQTGEVISSRNVLKMKLAEAKQAFAEKKIPFPSGWGGYRVSPITVEFWQGHPNGIHDRILYSKNDDNSWVTQRLMP